MSDDNYNDVDEYNEDGFEDINSDDERELEILSDRKNQRQQNGGKKEKNSRTTAIFVICFLVLATVAFIGRGKISLMITSILPNAVESGDGALAEEDLEDAELEDAFAGDEKSPQITLESSTKATFVGYDKNFLYCTKDGVKMYDSNYDALWGYTYTLTSPSVINDGKITAVAELQGRVLRVYDENGEKYSIQTDGSILQMGVSDSGAIGTILKTDNGYKIQAYSETGQLLMERIDQDEGIYPVSLDLTDDKKVLAVSYIDTTDIEIVGKVLFFHTSKADAIGSETGDFFASTAKNNTLITVVKYMDNNSFVSVGDNKIFAMDTAGEELWEIPLENKIDYISFGGDNYIAVAYGECLTSDEGLEVGTVVVYDSNGKEKFKTPIGRPVTYLSAYEKGVVIGAGREFICMNYNKSVQWSHTATQDIKDIILLSSPNSALYVTNGFAKIVDMKE